MGHFWHGNAWKRGMQGHTSSIDLKIKKARKASVIRIRTFESESFPPCALVPGIIIPEEEKDT